MFAVAPQARKFLEEKIRPKRVPVEANSAEAQVRSVDMITAADSLKTIKVEWKLNGESGLFSVDGGSEICVMPKSTVDSYGIAIKEIDGGLIIAAKNV